MTRRSQRAVLLCCLAMLGAAGCNVFGLRGSIAQRLQAEDPDVRITAIHDADRSGDRELLPLLVERLSDSHEEVRLFAFIALRRRTGKTLGYHYYDPRDERQKAIERWREYLRRNGLDGKAKTQGDEPNAPTRKGGKA